MNRITYIIFIFFIIAVNTFSQSSVTITVDTKAPGQVISADFIGESFETASIRINNNGVKGYFFGPANKQLITLFHELGIKNLRIGGGTVDNIKVNPTKDDIDQLFGFAKAAGVKIIYSVRLRSGEEKEDAETAKYIWDHYKDLLVCFAIGNESDWHSFHIVDPQIFEATPGVPGSAYPSFIKKWRRIADAISTAVPDAKFTGPDTGTNYPVPGAKDTGYNGKSWTVNFADDEKNSGKILFISGHNYVGQDAESQNLTPAQMINQMLSPVWDNSYYPAFYNASCTPALPKGLGYRLTESNSFSGGVKGGSNCFATALFALDYLHWWAAHNCLGINFHTTQWRYNGTFYHDKNGDYHIYPMGYGIKAFNISGHGKVKPVAISNPDSLNLTAYAVQDANSLYITLINKEHGSNAQKADVKIKAIGSSRNAYVMFLTAPDDDASATSGMMLGGSAITNDGAWQGKWMRLNSGRAGNYNVSVNATSAAIVKITAQ